MAFSAVLGVFYLLGRYDKGLALSVHYHWLGYDLNRMGSDFLARLCPCKLGLHRIGGIALVELVVHGLHELGVLRVHAVLGLLRCLSRAIALLGQLLIGRGLGVRVVVTTHCVVLLVVP